jgi:hypothetical protein
MMSRSPRFVIKLDARRSRGWQTSGLETIFLLHHSIPTSHFVLYERSLEESPLSANSMIATTIRRSGERIGQRGGLLAQSSVRDDRESIRYLRDNCPPTVTICLADSIELEKSYSCQNNIIHEMIIVIAIDIRATWVQFVSPSSVISQLLYARL